MHTENRNQNLEENVRKRVTSLPSLDRSELLDIWEGAFGAPPPPKLRKELMVPILAYRIQESAFGGLSNSTRKRLELLIAANREKRSSKPTTPEIPERSEKLIRSWRGEVHEVFVTDTGFVYRGECFQKLSPIAKRITGTQWSGPAFFGTKKKAIDA